MKTYLDCYPCFLRQALEAARMAGADEGKQREVLNRVMDELRAMDSTSTPPEMGHRIHRIVRTEMDADDPYAKAKAYSTRQALSLYPRLKDLVRAAKDPLECAVRLTIAGNVIDLAIGNTRTSHDTLWDAVETIQKQPFTRDDLALFRQELADAQSVLYLADNAGETVFDRVLIETLNRPTLYAVKGGPVLNDATAQDALDAGIDGMAQIMSNGSDAPGTILALCSPEFRREFGRAEMIIAKGQANYETLSEHEGPIFFLLKAKCSVIAEDAGVPVGAILCKGGEKYAEI